MSDSIFSTQPQSNVAMMKAQIKRVEGSIPYLRRTAQVASTSNVKAPKQSGVNPLTGSLPGAGQVNPASGIQNVGNNFSFYTQGNIGFTATSNSITLWWDGTNGSNPLVIKRVDGTSFSITKGSLTIEGLNASTLYGFLPFNCLTNQDALSFCAGDAGTPRFAFSPNASDELKASANQIQNLSSNEAVTESFIWFSTAGGGTIIGEGSPGVINPYSERRDPPGPDSGGGGGGTVTGVTGTAPIASTGGANPNISVAVADTSNVGVVKPDGTTITIDPDGTIHASGVTLSFADNETPAVVSGTVFTLAHTPSPSASLELFVNGLLQIQGTDYTLATATVTYGVAPTITTHKAWYRY